MAIPAASGLPGITAVSGAASTPSRKDPRDGRVRNRFDAGRPGL